MSRGPTLTAVLKAGRRRRTPRLDIAWYPNDTGHPRLGLIVPLHGATAVARNLLRRRLREIARRRILPKLPGVDLVVRSRPAAYQCNFTQLCTDLDRWLQTV